MTGSDAQIEPFSDVGRHSTRGSNVRPIYGTSRLASVGHVTKQ